MSEPIAKVGMAPCHPGAFIREEIPNELHLPVARAARILLGGQHEMLRRPQPVLQSIL